MQIIKIILFYATVKGRQAQQPHGLSNGQVQFVTKRHRDEAKNRESGYEKWRKRERERESVGEDNQQSHINKPNTQHLKFH